MGRSGTFYCKTCKVEVYLGYGGYGSWMDQHRSVKDWDAHAKSVPKDADLRKNQRMRQCLELHEGHDVETHSGDWAHNHGTVVCGEFGAYGACVPLFDTEGWRYVGEEDKIVSSNVRPTCILEVDSPSYPPTDDELRQCGCALCLRSLERAPAP
jgi:hypothetical protein